MQTEVDFVEMQEDYRQYRQVQLFQNLGLQVPSLLGLLVYPEIFNYY
jgi:hypothetical protein